ncbi:MAG: hypothetical protein KC731_20890 [Myxococcales bacterium]|nr:hypothetical protein [Myxococcales bacterium]
MRKVVVASSLIALSAHACRQWDLYDPRLLADGGNGGSLADGGHGGAGASDGGTAATGGAGGLGGGGGGSSGACNQVTLLGDDFTGPELDGRWNVELGGAATIDLVGGELLFTAQDDAYAALYSRAFYDLTDAAFTVDLGTLPPNGFDDLDISLVVPTWQEELEWNLSGNLLEAAYHLDGNHTTVGTVTYAPDEHDRLRIRHADDTVFWETSPDGRRWNVVGQLAASGLFPLDLLYTEIWVAAGAGNQVELGVTSVNEGLVEGVHCPMGDLSDDFEDGVVGRDWGTWSGDGCSILEGGEMTFAITMDMQTGCGLESRRNYDLTGGTATVQVLGSSTTDESDLAFVLGDPSGANEVAFVIRNGNFQAHYVVDGVWTGLGSAPLGADPDRYFRFREQDGRISYELSIDGSEWTAFSEIDAPFDPQAVTFAVYGGSWGPTNPNEQLVFDNVNPL